MKEFGLTYFGMDDKRQGQLHHTPSGGWEQMLTSVTYPGIVHIIGPEQGFTLPGTILVCGDSHTSSKTTCLAGSTLSMLIAVSSRRIWCSCIRYRDLRG